ncbi:MAG: lipopolysaccharide biosynthesis protein [Luteolibacter sp.]
MNHATINPRAGSETSSDQKSLRKKSVRGGAVTMLSQLVNTGIQVASTVILARMLSPEEFGIIAMVVSITSFAGLFRDLGLSSAAIQKSDLSREQQSNLFWLNAAVGTLLTLLVAMAAPLVARFYQKPELMSVTLALSVTFVVGSLGTQHGAMLVRNMQFLRQAIATVAGALTTLITAVVLSSTGMSYWSLVWGTIAGSVSTTLLLILLSPFRPCRPMRGTGIRGLVKFGANVTGFNLVNFFHRSLDNILIGRTWGAGSLGFYSRAYQLLMFPINAIRGPITAVAYPAMSRLQDQPEAFRSYYRKITALLSLASMPLVAYLYVEAGPVVELLLGNQWSGVTPIFKYLALTAFIQPVASLRGMVILSTGRSGDYLAWGCLNSGVVVTGFLIGNHWGPVGIAISYAISNYLLLYPSLILAFRNTPLTHADFFIPIARSTASSVAAAIVLSLFLEHLETFSTWLRVGTSATAFAASFLGFYALIPGGYRELRHHGSLLGELRTRAVPSC